MQRPIPLWIGGHADTALRRIARLADGWLPLGKPAEVGQLVERLRLYTGEAGRDPVAIGIEATVYAREGQLEEWVRLTGEGEWRDLGATHITFGTTGTGFKSVNEHIEAIRRYKEAIEP